jgi:hypothetical protein
VIREVMNVTATDKYVHHALLYVWLVSIKSADCSNLLSLHDLTLLPVSRPSLCPGVFNGKYSNPLS